MRNSISPCPPESTTPASFSTGSKSGVWANTSSPYSIISAHTSSRLRPESTRNAAFSAIPFATVRIVPSFGFMTALYAVSTARIKPSANTWTSICSCSLISRQKPRKSCDKITPELPRAPRREPLEIVFASSSIDGLTRALTSLDAAIIVNDIFDPVSPSGTGKTFNSFI